MSQFRLWIFVLLLSASACTLMPDPDTAATPVMPRPVTLVPSSPQPTRTSVSTINRFAEGVAITPIGNCPSAPRIRLIIQERGQVTESEERLNIRNGPGTDYNVVGRMEPGDIFFVLDGPECAEIYSWFRVRYGDQEGWIAEGDPEQYFAQPYLPG